MIKHHIQTLSASVNDIKRTLLNTDVVIFRGHFKGHKAVIRSVNVTIYQLEVLVEVKLDIRSDKQNIIITDRKYGAKWLDHSYLYGAECR